MAKPPPRIVLVEDDDDIAAVVHRALSDAGYSVHLRTSTMHVPAESGDGVTIELADASLAGVVGPARTRSAAVLVVERLSDEGPPGSGAVLDYDGITIDMVRREVRVHGAPADLTSRQFSLLALLASNPGRVFGREELLRLVWGSSSEWQSPATVTEHIHRIRRRIEEDPARPRFLRTVRGGGYLFDTPSPDLRDQGPS